LPFQSTNRDQARLSTEKTRPRKGALLLLAFGILLLFVVVFSQSAFNLAFLRPNTAEQTLIFAAVSAIVFLLFIALFFVLVRNLLRLYAERRLGKLGSKFRTRMVIGALLLSFIPVLFLFLFAYELMNRSIDRWFSRPVEELREDSDRVAGLLFSYALDNARAEADSIAAMPQTKQSYATGNFNPLLQVFREREKTLQGGFALALYDSDLVAALNAPEAWGELRSKLPPIAQLSKQDNRPFVIDDRDSVAAAAAVGVHGQIVIVMPLPANYRATINQIDASQRNYYELSNQRRQVRRTYLGVLLLLTVLVLFFATWLALFLSKLVTKPVEALAEATQEISRGRFDYRVEVAAADELGELVASFNRMAAELELARRAMEDSSRKLAGANTELEQRRRHMETVLESIPTGVLSLDASHRIVHANMALRRMFSDARGNGLHEFPVGAPVNDLFAPSIVSDLQSMMRKSDRMGAATSQLEIDAQHARLNVAITVSSLHHGSQRLGYVVVFDDLSDLLKANKQAAWHEVARRIAHEIKNPLTPIALSAERIQRRLERDRATDEGSLKVIADCARTISTAVETVRALVDEFSAMARFPASQPQPSDVNAIVESALALFNGRLDGINVSTSLAPNLPPVMADANAIQRAIANLVDNAAEAMQESLVREVQISTALVASRDVVEIMVADSGPGVSQDLKEKLFFPYFSTKKRGTGLGLAIVSRIVEEHHGSVRVEENSPVGARFVVELPVASEAIRETESAGRQTA
jgi:nitrogen fixation/metabolism regulation signal transduction histidine kinase